MGFNIDSAFPSKYLKAADFDTGDGDYQDQVFTITKVTKEAIGQGADADTKPVVYFEETDLGLCLNKTNARTITDVVGSPQTDMWTGKKIVVGVKEDVEFSGKIGPAIRVRNKHVTGSAENGIPAPAKSLTPVEEFMHWAIEDGQWKASDPITREQQVALIRKVLGWTDDRLPKGDDIRAAAAALKEKVENDPFGANE